MKPVQGILTDTSVLISKPKDVGRLYGKSRFGKTLSGNTLQLHLIEAVYLVDEEKLTLKKDDCPISLQELISIAAKQNPSFETLFLSFQDLRHRGYQVEICENSAFCSFQIQKKTDSQPNQTIYISAFSERIPLTLSALTRLVTEAMHTQASCWISIVDEEGDITYYDLILLPPEGVIEQKKYPHTTGILLENRAIILDTNKAALLHDKEFYGKPFCKGLQLSPIEAAYLTKKKTCSFLSASNQKTASFTTLQKTLSKKQPEFSKIFSVYEDLKQRKMIVKTGFKFGAHFRAYTNNPSTTHAEYIIQVIKDTYETSWPEISRGVRLAHSVNKIFIYAMVSKNQDISYLQFRRLRP